MLRIIGLIVVPAIVLGVLLIYRRAVFMLPSLVVDLLIGLIVILPIVAFQTRRSKKA